MPMSGVLVFVSVRVVMLADSGRRVPLGWRRRFTVDAEASEGAGRRRVGRKGRLRKMQEMTRMPSGASTPPVVPVSTIVPELPPLPSPRATDDRLVLDSVTYACPLGFRPLLMDVHLPSERGGPVPCVVWIHGGAWREGDRRFPPG